MQIVKEYSELKQKAPDMTPENTTSMNPSVCEEFKIPKNLNNSIEDEHSKNLFDFSIEGPLLKEDKSNSTSDLKWKNSKHFL